MHRDYTTTPGKRKPNFRVNQALGGTSSIANFEPRSLMVRSVRQSRVFWLRFAGKSSPAWHPFSQASLRFSLNQDTKQTGEAWRKILSQLGGETGRVDEGASPKASPPRPSSAAGRGRGPRGNDAERAENGLRCGISAGRKVDARLKSRRPSMAGRIGSSGFSTRNLQLSLCLPGLESLRKVSSETSIT